MCDKIPCENNTIIDEFSSVCMNAVKLEILLEVENDFLITLFSF